MRGAMQSELRIDAATGLVPGARQVLSPHYDARPAGVQPELVVVHGISLPPGQFGGPYIEQLFTGNLPPGGHAYFAEVAPLRVSAHALIRRDGSLVQFVPFAGRAWHAGVSSWCGREACNDYSIGIELEGTDDENYELVQYRTLAMLIRALIVAYPGITPERVVGHSDVAPGRKSDPGAAFDWAELHRRLGPDW